MADDGFSNPNRIDPQEENARAARLARRQQAGRELARQASEPIAKGASKITGKGVEKGTEYGTRGTAAASGAVIGGIGGAAGGALAGGVGAVPGFFAGAQAGSQTGWTGSAVPAKIFGKGTGKAAEIGTRAAVRKTAETAGGAAAGLWSVGGKTNPKGAGSDPLDQIPGFVFGLAKKPLESMIVPALIIGGLLVAMGMVMILVTVIVSPLDIL